MGYGNYRADYARTTGEGRAVLPSDGERLAFGTHRLDYTERECPAWPSNAHKSADARYSAMLKRERKNPAYILAVLARQNERGQVAA